MSTTKKTVHIIVQGGLVQDVFAENVDVDVIVYDLDTDDNEEYDSLVKELERVKKTSEHVY